jgi:tRNA A-37 threonylcarbamoyl transferase component Bud32
VALYTRLHAAGVVHVSCSPKHWLRANGTFRLIDFGCRWVRSGVPSGRVIEHRAFEFQAAEEMTKVRRVLGLAVWGKT